MFTTFLTLTAFASILAMGYLLLGPERRAKPLSFPVAGVAVAALTLALVALGLWMN